MVNFFIFTLLLVFLWASLERLFTFGLSGIRSNYERLFSDYSFSEKKHRQIKKDNEFLEDRFEKTVALYDITKEICKSLEGERVFGAFKENMQRYIRVDDCKLLHPDEDIVKYSNYTIVPLNAYKKTIGFLAVSGLKTIDTDKFHIIAQQFMLGIKRALLYKEVQELTITDNLTQVFTRRYFMERFIEELDRSKKFKHKFSFLMIDIDRFKEFNDRYGHLVGDVVLREITKTIKDTVRQIDLIGRYGGEELSIILTETDKDQARFAAERLRRAIESKCIKAYDEDLKATVSIGISTYPADANDAKSLIEKADEALYNAKEAGRNRICLYQPRR